jgi:hypothetical protein
MWRRNSQLGFATCRIAHLIGAVEHDPLDSPSTLTVNEILAVMSLGPSCLYRSWKRPKADGGTRTINSPVEPLRSIQKRLLRLLYGVPVSDIVHGYVPKRNLATNALLHRNSRSALLLDLSDAFGSVSFHRQFYQWPKHEVLPCVKFGVDMPMLRVIAELVDIKDEWGRYKLAQGAPTSPHVFNLICSETLDPLLLELAERFNGTVTRYADNITFSFPQSRIDAPVIGAIIRTLHRRTAFDVNPRKTRVIHDANCPGKPLPLVGVNVVNGKLYLPPLTVERFRLALYNAGLTGDRAVYHGIVGHINQICEDMPARLEGIYEKARDKSQGRSP